MAEPKESEERKKTQRKVTGELLVDRRGLPELDRRLERMRLIGEKGTEVVGRVFASLGGLLMGFCSSLSKM